MIIKYFCKFLLTTILLNISIAERSFAQFNYPVTKMEAFDTVIYNRKLTDNYAWLSRSENEKEMLNWSRQQGEFTNILLDSIPGTEILDSLFEKLYVPKPDEIIVKGTQGNDVYYYKTMADGKRWRSEERRV